MYVNFEMYGEQYLLNYILLANKEDFSKIKNPNEIVIRLPEIRVLFDYPLKLGSIETLKAANGDCFTRRCLVESIAKRYRAVLVKSVMFDGYSFEWLSRVVPSLALHRMTGLDEINFVFQLEMFDVS